MWTLSNLRLEIKSAVAGSKRLVRDSGNVATDRLLNAAARDVVLWTKCLRRKVPFTTTENTGEYDFTTAVLQILNVVYYDSSAEEYSEPLIQTTEEWLDEYESNWRSQDGGGDHTHFYLRGQTLGIFSAADATGDTIHADIVPQPVTMSSAGSDPFTVLNAAGDGNVSTYQPQSLYELLIDAASIRLWREANQFKRADAIQERIFAIDIPIIQKTMRDKFLESKKTQISVRDYRSEV